MSTTIEPKRVSFSAMWSDKLGAEINRRSTETYPVEFHPGSADMRTFEAVVNRGIDAHLEAIFFKEGAGGCGQGRFEIEPQSVSVLVRRLMESDDDNAQSLASSICETLGIELI